MRGASTNPAVPSSLSWDGANDPTHPTHPPARQVAPVWFGAQLTFTASLQFTSVTSNTVLSSCSSLFVYLGALALRE